MNKILKISSILFILTSIIACQIPGTSLDNDPVIRANATPTEYLLNTPTASPTPIETNSADDERVIINYTDSVALSPIYYGTNGWWTDQDANIWRDRHRQLGINIVRIPMLQGLFEPKNDDSAYDHINPGGFLFDQPLTLTGKTLNLKKWLEMLRDLDVTIMVYIPYIAGWLSANGDEGSISTYPPKNIDEYREYVRALLQFIIFDVGFSPEKIIFEPVNEPDLGCEVGAVVSCFWKNWKADDLISVLKAAYTEAKTVNSSIRVVGVAECCGTAVIDRLMTKYDGSTYLDGFTYHKYVSDFNFTEGIQRGIHLKGYGKPVFLNEYGNTQVWSNGVEGALWHSLTLPQIWKANINLLQFPISDFPGSHEGFNQLGLFTDWRDNWRSKPAYWIYTNFFNQFGGGEIVKVVTSKSMDILASRKKTPEGNIVNIWLTNINSNSIGHLPIRIENYPYQKAKILIFDNLLGSDPIKTLNRDGSPLEFILDLPAQSSYSVLVKPWR